MDNSLEIARMRKQLRRMQICLIAGVAAATATVVLQGASGTATARGSGKVRFDHIEVQRIDVVEPNGKPRMVLSNKPKSPGVIVDGVDLGNAGTRPGTTFYNSEGDEAGGLGTDSRVVDGEKLAFGQLSFDQYKQDQTLVLRYAEQEGVRGVGLAVQDRPDAPLQNILEEHRTIMQMPPGPERDRALAAFEKKYPNPQRVFIGKNYDKSSMVTLADGKGTPRIVLRVGHDGNPQIQFLNAKGKVTRTVTG